MATTAKIAKEQKTAYEIKECDWSSDVCSSDLGFDGRGNYTLGLRDQLLFPEIDYMKVDKARGMNVSVVTTAKTDEEARKLLQFIGIPFRTS